MAIYEGICSGENSIESTWALMGLACKLAQSVSFLFIVLRMNDLFFLVGWSTYVDFFKIDDLPSSSFIFMIYLFHFFFFWH